jgi:DeoR/GlpR family transcriptional regulator of sugar metabolism
MKNLTPRQQEILKLVEQKDTLSIDEIQRAIGISQATSYREIQSLARLGLVAKIPGGISRAEASSSFCIQCGKEINFRVVFLIEKKNGQHASACCPHCGLMAVSSHGDISTAMAIDFFYGTRLSARQASYVLGSEVGLCCHPSVLTFSNRNDADSFVKGFGGTVMDFVTAQNTVNKVMEL